MQLKPTTLRTNRGLIQTAGNSICGVLRGFYPAERLIMLFALLALALYRYSGMPLRTPFRLYTDRLWEGLTLYGVGLVLTLLGIRLVEIKAAHKSGRRTLRDTWFRYRQEFLSFPTLFHDVRLVNAIALVFVVFIHLKHLIPQLNPRLYDEYFFSRERALLGGKLAGEYLHLLGFPGLAEVLSYLYEFFYPYLALLVFFFILQRNKHAAQQFVTSFTLIWFLGILLVYLIPTWGPCFFRPEVYATLPATDVSRIQAELWKNKVFLDHHPHSRAGIFLISGFPSLHLTVPLLGAALARRRNYLVFLGSGAFSVLTLVSMLYFGWHYLVDAIGAFLVLGLALILQKISARYGLL